MIIIRNLIVAFSLFSRIPVPSFEWKDSDMKYNLVFLPWVGAVIGALAYLAAYASMLLKLPEIPRLLLLSTVPLLVTGGFHVDGFLDVKDALSSYKPREEKLRILKDPHIGAFAVIGLLIFSLLWGAALFSAGLLENAGCLLLFCLEFYTVRCISALCALTFKHARSDGMLSMETKHADRGSVIALSVELLTGITAMLFADTVPALFMTAGLGLFTLYYRRLCYKQFGGVTGDTAGYFVCAGELVCLIMLAVGNLIAI